MHLQMLKIGCVNYARFPKSSHIYDTHVAYQSMHMLMTLCSYVIDISLQLIPLEPI